MSYELERIGTAERESAAALIADAAAGGYLDTDEFTERSAAAYAARTRGELDRILTDLPPTWLKAREATRRRERHIAAARAGMRWHLGGYVAGSLLMIVIWLAVGVSAGAWYPWPIWPILGWGIGVFGHVLPVRHAVRRGVARV
jgi:Flp pilus assembly protein TadB